MKELFEDILKMDGIKGVLLVSFNGDIIFKEFSSDTEDPVNRDWAEMMHLLDGIRESDMVFNGGRLYIRKTELGYLIIVMAVFSSAAMVRLNCDIILPSLTPTKKAKSLKGFFKKK